MPDQTDTRYVVSSSPHVHAGTSVHGIMRDVIIAMLPALAFAIFFFGVAAIKLVVTCVVACVVTEVVCRKAMRRDAGVWDLSAVVTGLLLAFNLPPSLPLWQAAVGSVVTVADDLDYRGRAGIIAADLSNGTGLAQGDLFAV